MALQVDIDRLGTDVALPEREGDALPKTTSGDLALVSGRENVRRAQIRRVTVPAGCTLWWPEYGAGVEEFVERPNTPANQSLLAARCRRQMLRDPRLKDARARARAGTVDDAGADLVVTLSYQLRDDTQEELTVPLSE